MKKISHSRQFRLALIAMLCLSLLSTWQMVVAATPQTAEVLEELNLRAEPDKNAEILTTIPAGNVITLSGENENGFLQTTWSGQSGWVSADYLEPEHTDLPTSGPAKVLSPVNLRTEASTGSNVLASLPAGARVEITGDMIEGFVPVTIDDQSGWVYSAYLEAVESLASSTGDTLYATDQVNLRSGPGTDSEVLLVLPLNAELSVIGNSQSGFAHVSYEDTEGWASEDFLAAQSVPVQSWMSTSAGLNLRTKPNSSSNILLVIPEGAVVSTFGKADGDFTQVTYNGQEGWAASEYLQPLADLPAPTNIPVLMYHNLDSYPERYRITYEMFDQQMAWLFSNGYTAITPDGLLAWLDSGQPLPPNPVMITIDDGYLSAVDAQSILDQYGFPGVYFIPSYSDLTADQLTALDQAGQVCGHSVTHPFMNTLSWQGQWEEVTENLDYLAGQIGHTVDCFGYPFGIYDSNSTDVVQQAGLSIVFDATGGHAPLDGSLDRWHVQRIEVSGLIDMDGFVGLVQG